jgi:hypothetical protein
VPDIRPIDPFFILGCVFVGVSILCSAVAYGYGAYLESDSVKLKAESQLIEQDLKQYPLQDMLEFNNKVVRVQKLLKNHTFPETILAALGAGVEPNVYYNSFNLIYTPGVGHTLALSAIAPDYASVARQMDTLKNKTAYGTLFNSVEMTSLGKDQDGNKLFDIRINVVGSLRKYQAPTGGSVQSQSNTSSIRPSIITAPIVPPPVKLQNLQQATSSTASSTIL